MGKKSKNKTAKKQYFKELGQFLREKSETAEKLVKNDLETFAMLLEFADISKELDLSVLIKLLEALWDSTEKIEDTIEIFFNLARHNILAILFKMMIVLKKKVLTNYKQLQIILLYEILALFNMSLGLKRVHKLLRSTEGFETISQPEFWAPIHFSPKLNDSVKVQCLLFSIRISLQKSFTKKFVENYVALARECVSTKCTIDFMEWFRSISRIILESDQGEFFLKLVSDLPEKSFLIASESVAEKMKTHCVLGRALALVKCAKCGVFEKSEKQFQKCSRCGSVFYCSKVCQRSDWQNHKQICKQIGKQN